VSLQAIRWALTQEPRSAHHKWVLTLLADWANKNGGCFPRQSTIATRAMLSLRSVNSILADLEADGYLSRQQTRRRDGKRGTDRIWLQLSSISKISNVQGLHTGQRAGFAQH
jgi:hypothetical protein